MILYFLLICLIAIAGLKYAGKGQFLANYLDKDKIQAVKGIFILLIIASHFTQYVEYSWPLSEPYLFIRKILGQMVVVPFLFYSGYGVAVSASQKGYSYIRRMPVKRILSVLFQFDIAVLLFYCVRRLLGDVFTVKQLLVAFTAWESVGNSNWYILTILLLYLLSFAVCFGLSEGERFERKREAAWVLLALSLCLIWILRRHRPGWYYNTLTAYSVGFLYAVYKDKLEKILFRSERGWWLYFGSLLLLFYIFRKNWDKSLTAYLAAGAVFALGIVMFTAKFSISSRFLKYCGEHLFSLFILQRLPMIVLAKTPLSGNIPLYFALSFVITFALAWVFDQTVPRLWLRISSILFPERKRIET